MLVLFTQALGKLVCRIIAADLLSVKLYLVHEIAFVTRSDNIRPASPISHPFYPHMHQECHPHAAVLVPSCFTINAAHKQVGATPAFAPPPACSSGTAVQQHVLIRWSFGCSCCCSCPVVFRSTFWPWPSTYPQHPQPAWLPQQPAPATTTWQVAKRHLPC